MIGLAINTESSIINLTLQRTIQIHQHLEKINMFQINWFKHLKGPEMLNFAQSVAL